MKNNQQQTRLHASSQPIEVGFFVVDGFSMMCFANAVEPLRAANMILGERLFERTVITPQGKPAISSSNLSLLADTEPSEAKQFDWLFVIASYDYLQYTDKATLASIRTLSRDVQLLGGFDCGSWLLAQAGLLNKHKATMHWQELNLFAERFKQVDVCDQRYVIDKQRISAGGAIATLDVMLELLREVGGKALFYDVRNLFLHDSAQTANRQQRSHALAQDTPPILHKVIDLMEQHIEMPLKLVDIAKQVSVSLRSMGRLFGQHLGMSPGQYYLLLRLKTARRLIAETRLSITEISLRCGFNSPQAFSRAYKIKFGTSPRESRRSRTLL